MVWINLFLVILRTRSFNLFHIRTPVKWKLSGEQFINISGVKQIRIEQLKSKEWQSDFKEDIKKQVISSDLWTTDATFVGLERRAQNAGAVPVSTS